MSTPNSDEEVQVQKLLAELTHGPVALSGAPERDTRRVRLLPKLRQQVTHIPLQRAQQKQRHQRTTWAFAAAAVLAAGGGLGSWLAKPAPSEAQLLIIQPRGNAVEIVDRGQHRTVTESASIAASGRLETNESAALTTAEGVLVELAAHTRIGLDELNSDAGWRLQLRQGHVACEVPKLTEKKTFSVVTDDAEVIVHGTRFTVTSDAASTCVRVTEGRVEVRSKGARTFLTPGQHWGCDQAASTDTNVAPAPAVQTPPNVKVESSERKMGSRGAEPKPNSGQPAGTLALETELVGRALTAERRGDGAAAQSLYAQFLERYPNSPMAPEARRGLRRVSQPR